ncbi:MAG: extracellular solute-binding protein [Eubacteriales bacterium]|jgi:putative aldouronate transport system substrate-binding protein|nr:extracellular solute-binding protein [Eubacteriales bacterium]
MSVKSIKKGFFFMVGLLMAATIISGCANRGGDNQKSTSSQAITTPIGQYPIETEETLTYWGVLNTNTAKNYTNFADTPIGKELEKKTGVTVKYIHPAQGQQQEQLNILLASNDYPDIIESNWTSGYPGGAEKAIEDGIIIPINDLMKFSPNYERELSGIPGLDKMARTDSGKYYVYATIRKNYEESIFWGPMFRKDWLDDLGLEPPTTIDEWEKVLIEFRDKKNATAPFAVRANQANGSMLLYGAIVGAYKTELSWYTDNDKIYFGPYDPQYKDFLAIMARWYKQNLLDKDFPMADKKSIESKVLSGKSGAFIGLIGSEMGTYLRVMQEKDERFDLIGAANPTLSKDEESFSGAANLPFYYYFAAAITTHCKNPELAARWLDYGYTEEGAYINNFGVENESFVIEDGVLRYTDTVINAPVEENMLARYDRFNGPYVALILPATSEQTMLPQQIQAREAFKKNMPVYRGYPPLTFTVEESERLSNIMNNINNYANEMRTKFIMGTEPLENYDKYIEQLKSMGIEEAVKIQQDAYIRYQNR